MLPRPACHRAVQRQLLSPTDSIWISDEAVSQIFQKFARGSKVGRRYGSFVPGPMESRRRLGRRRMTLQSDATPIPLFDPGWFRGWFGEKDWTQWHWEAPTTRASNYEAGNQALPSWLLEWTTIPKKDASVPMVKNHARDRRKGLSFGVVEVAAFRSELEACSGDSFVICNDFSQRLKQNLILGLVSEETLKHIFKAIPEMIMHLDIDMTEAQTRCLQFYQAVWDGINSCKVIQPEDLHGKTLNRLVDLICQLPTTAESRELGSRIVCSASRSQLSHMRDGINKFIVSWIRTFLHTASPADAGAFMPETTNAVTEVGVKINTVEKLSAYLRSDVLSDDSGLQILAKLPEAKKGLSLAFDKVRVGNHAIDPVHTSTITLMKVLGHLPDAMVRSVIRSSASFIADNGFGISDEMNERLQRHFLSLVAQVPAVGDAPFENILKSATCSIGPSFLSSLVLHQWISQGYLKEAAIVSDTFELTANATGQRDIATLLLAVDKHKEMCWARMRKLVVLFHALGQQRTTHQIMIRVHKAGMKVPADVMGPVIESVSILDARLALDLYHLYSAMRINFTPLRLELCPNFIHSMINDSGIKPETIWKVLGIPLYESEGPGFSEKMLSPPMIELLSKAAVAFAHSNRPPRVAFRNVEQCLHHLRRHRAPITSDLTKSIAHSGITSKIKEGKWVPKGRAAWALSLVAAAEGTKVAITADMAVSYWNGSIQEKRYREKRERNVLRVGPIN